MAGASHRIHALAGVAALATALPAAAVDRYEIQVYEADLNAPGHAGVELHLNDGLQAAPGPEFPGGLPLDHAFHATVEPAIGVAEWLELGGYLLSAAAPGWGYRYAGWKLRAKMVVPVRLTAPFFVGLNLEVGQVPPEVEPASWSSEIRPILGYDDGTFLVDVNPIVGFALSGADRLRPELEPALKASVNTQLGFALGVEYYTGLGFAGDLLPLRAQEHLLFAVFDLVAPRGAPPGGWEVNVALGAGLTAASPERWIAKAIVGRSF